MRKKGRLALPGVLILSMLFCSFQQASSQTNFDRHSEKLSNLFEKFETEGRSEERKALITAFVETENESEQLIHALIENLENDNEWIRYISAEALGFLKATDAVPALIEKLGDDSTAVIGSAAWALGRLRSASQKVVPSLIEILKNNNGYVRMLVASALAEIGPSAVEAVPALVESFRIENPTSACNLAPWFPGDPKERIPPKLPERIQEFENDNEHFEYSAMDAFFHIIETSNKDTSPILVDALKDDNACIRYTASLAVFIKCYQSKEITDILLTALNDNDARVSYMSAKSIALIQDPPREAVPLLLNQLINDNRYVRSNALQTLKRFRTEDKEEAVPVLIQLLKDEYLREKATTALGKLGPVAKKAVPQLIQLLKDENENVRFKSAIALGDIGSSARIAVPALLVAKTKNSQKVVQEIEKALEKIENDSSTSKSSDSLQEE